MSDETLEQMAEAMRDRADKVRNRLSELHENNPLIGKGPAEMAEINARNQKYQDAMRDGMIIGLITADDPIAGFNSAMTALLRALAAEEDSEQAAEAIGYIFSLSNAIKEMEGGPLAILNGELKVECMLRPGDTPTQEMREKLGLPEGPVTETGSRIRREGNVVDASEMFAAAGASKRTLH